MSKVHYLNSHLDKYREKSKITIDVEKIGALADYNILGKEDKKTTKIFTECFKNKESYKELLKKLPNNIAEMIFPTPPVGARGFALISQPNKCQLQQPKITNKSLGL